MICIDFSKLGAGAGGAMPEMGDMPGDSDDDMGEGEDDMPGLEGEEEEVEGKGKGKAGEAVDETEAPSATGGAKIEEVP